MADSLRASIAGASTVEQVRAAALDASRMPVRAVLDELSYEFLDEHADRAVVFFEPWLASLSPLERLRAAEWVAGECMTSVVHVPHAYGIAARLHASALAAAAGALAASLDSFVALTEGPDAEVSAEDGARAARLAAETREIGGRIGELSSSVHRSTRIAESGA